MATAAPSVATDSVPLPPAFTLPNTGVVLQFGASSADLTSEAVDALKAAPESGSYSEEGLPRILGRRRLW